MSDIQANHERRLIELEKEVRDLKSVLGLVNGHVLDIEKRSKANFLYLVNANSTLTAAETALSAVADALLAEASEETLQKVAESLKRSYEQYKGQGSPFVERYQAVSQGLVPGINLS